MAQMQQQRAPCCPSKAAVLFDDIMLLQYIVVLHGAACEHVQHERVLNPPSMQVCSESITYAQLAMMQQRIRKFALVYSRCCSQPAFENSCKGTCNSCSGG
jgi:hypothetical protein